MELGKAIPHKITIKPSANKGFIVDIGCGTFVAENTTSLLNGIKEYLYDPWGLEKEYNHKLEPENPLPDRRHTVSGESPGVQLGPGVANQVPDCEG